MRLSRLLAADDDEEDGSEGEEEEVDDEEDDDEDEDDEDEDDEDYDGEEGPGTAGLLGEGDEEDDDEDDDEYEDVGSAASCHSVSLPFAARWQHCVLAWYTHHRMIAPLSWAGANANRQQDASRCLRLAFDPHSWYAMTWGQ